jgi:hypothetical protein
MAYVMIEGYLCERCNYRWGTRNGNGIRGKEDPGHCPKCKTKYWNLPRKVEMPPDKLAKPWNQRKQTADRVA